jgi:hypothetical protein
MYNLYHSINSGKDLLGTWIGIAAKPRHFTHRWNFIDELWHKAAWPNTYWAGENTNTTIRGPEWKNLQRRLAQR